MSPTSPERASAPFTHLDAQGNARMTDVSAKQPTLRKALAEGFIVFSPSTIALLRDGTSAKGDIFTVAKIAGIMAAKRTSETIPLCHPLSLTKVDLSFEIREAECRIAVRAEVHTVAVTGVEMEALTAVSAALLTIYDMTKSADKSMILSDIRLLRKEGGASGTFVNPESQSVP